MLNKRVMKSKVGSKVRQNEVEYEDLESTEQLFNWISKMRTKKIKYLRKSKRNVRVEAVLGNALFEAEQELRRKQVARIYRWQELKLQEMANYNNKTNENNDNDSDALNMDCENGANKDNKEVWSADLHPELSSLDDFLSELSAIKAPVVR